MTPRLQAAIQNLYDTFYRYHGDSNMLGSPPYDDIDEWNKSLFSKPLQQLTGDNLSRFAGKVISTWGDTDDLKHFLPRVFELTALLETPYDVWILYKKLEDGAWLNWDKQEQNVINEFSLSLWESLLLDNSDEAEFEFRDYFPALAHFYPSFTDLIQIWMENNSYSSIKHLTNYVFDERQSIFDHSYISGMKKVKGTFLNSRNGLSLRL